MTFEVFIQFPPCVFIGFWIKFMSTLKFKSAVDPRAVASCTGLINEMNAMVKRYFYKGRLARRGYFSTDWNPTSPLSRLEFHNIEILVSIIIIQLTALYQTRRQHCLPPLKLYVEDKIFRSRCELSLMLIMISRRYN